MTARNIEDLIDLLNTSGGSAYFGEPVSILEHRLQAAHSAEQRRSLPSSSAHRPARLVKLFVMLVLPTTWRLPERPTFLPGVPGCSNIS
jgi:hypothetical protein